MLAGWTSVVLALCWQGAGKLERPEAIAAQASNDAVKELKEKAAKSAAAKSYAFELKTEREMGAAGGGSGNGGASGGGGAGGGGGGAGGGGGGRGGRGGFPTDTNPTLGKYAENQPVELKHGDVVAYRQGEKLVYEKNGSWELYSSDRGGRGDGGSRGGGGSSGGGAGGGGGNRRGGGGDMRERFALMGLAYVRLPHELLAGVESKLTDVKATDETGKRVITGNLTKEAADELSGAKRMRDFAGQRGAGGAAGGGAAGGGGEATATGTMKIVFNKGGAVETVTIDTKISGPNGNSTTKLTYTLRDFDSTKVEAPKEAAAKLGGAASGSH